jgi:hypothetical protein
LTKPAFVQDQPPATHDAVDAGAVFTEDELYHDVVGGDVMQRREIDKNKVRHVTFLDAANLLESQGAGAAVGRRAQRVASADPAADRAILNPRQI